VISDTYIRTYIRRVTAADGGNVPSTAVDRDRTCANAEGGLKNQRRATAVDGVLNAKFLRLPRVRTRLIAVSRRSLHVTTVNGRKRPQWELYFSVMPSLDGCNLQCTVIGIQLTLSHGTLKEKIAKRTINKNLRQWDWHISVHADPTSTRRPISRTAHL